MVGKGGCIMGNTEQPYQLIRLYGTVTVNEQVWCSRITQTRYNRCTQTHLPQLRSVHSSPPPPQLNNQGPTIITTQSYSFPIKGSQNKALCQKHTIHVWKYTQQILVYYRSGGPTTHWYPCAKRSAGALCMPLVRHKSHIKCPAGGAKSIANHLIHDSHHLTSAVKCMRITSLSGGGWSEFDHWVGGTRRRGVGPTGVKSS